MFPGSRELRFIWCEHGDADDLYGEPQVARALHAAVGHQRRAAGYEIGDPVRHLFEFAGLSSACHHQCECSVAGQHGPAGPRARQHLRVPV